MGKWRDAFNKSLGDDADYDVDAPFVFGPPATDEQLGALESALSAKLPHDLRELLKDFNGIRINSKFGVETYYFSTDEMPAASEFYSDWDNEIATKACRKVAFVCNQNGMAAMWGIVVRQIGPFKPGMIVLRLDHDQVTFAEDVSELFAQPYPNLLEFVEDKRKVCE